MLLEDNEQFQGFKAGIIFELEGKMVDLEGAIKLSNDKLIGGWAEVYREDNPVFIKYKSFLN
ncbi:hypothetical protein [Bacillus subtilis]|uniref:hypothetical protein n=1 Tax=Bacillus subtilis TaxID=1423 RepID=UPI003CEE49CE